MATKKSSAGDQPGTSPVPGSAAGSAAGQDTSLLEKMSAEVNPEASKLLEFITLNARKIVALFVLCIAGGVGYGVYTWYSADQLDKARAELGRIEMIQAAPERLAALEAFAAPGELVVAANLAMAATALEAEDFDKAAAAWEKVGAAEQGSFATVAVVGRADALIKGGKDAEALAFLQKHQNSGSDLARTMVDRMVLDLAEKLGNISVAIAACDSLATNPVSSGEAEFWRQKAAELKARQPS